MTTLGSIDWRRIARVRVAMISMLAFAGCSDDAADDPAQWRRFGFGSADVVEGRLQSLIARRDDGTSELIHRVVAGEQRIVLQLGDASPPPPRSWVRVWGHLGDAEALLPGEVLEVESLESLAPPPVPLLDPEPLPPRSLALALVHWGEPALDADEAQSRMWGDAESSQAYWSEISYGKETITGDVLGPYEIPWPGGCDPDAIAAYAEEAIAGEGRNPGDWQQLMVHFPSIGCGWGGLAMLGSPQQPERNSWYNGEFDCVVRNQEVAHNYGMMHTHFYYDCGSGPFGSNCNVEEYGSPYEPMGYGCGHVAAHQKEYMGWLEGCNSVAASASGTFNLVPTETPCDGIQALRLPTFDGREYYLEYRQPTGFDAADGLAGVLVHVSSTVDAWGPDGYLIDLGEGAFLAEGEAYADPAGTVSFTVRAQDAAHAEIEVAFPGGSGEPRCLDGTTPQQQDGAWGPIACAGGPVHPDGAAPTVAITSPSDGAGFEPGDSLAVTVDAQDDVGVTEVELYVADQLQGTLTQPPWQWHFPELLEGQYELVAVARDGIHETSSAAVHIVVAAGAGDAGDGDGGGDDAAGDGGGDGGDAAGDGSGGAPGHDALPPGFGLDASAPGCAIVSRGRARPLAAAAALALVVLGARRRRRSAARRIA